MKRGIRQRLQVDEATEAPPAATTTVRGGLRQRLCSASSSSTAPRAETAPYCARKQKLEAEPADVSNLPLNMSLRRDWARGSLPSNKVLEYAIGASSQGACGLESFAASTNRNAHRRVVAALGYPEKAPKISWIEIPVAGGGVKPQPILCPIDTLEALLTDPEKFEIGPLGYLVLKRRPGAKPMTSEDIRRLQKECDEEDFQRAMKLRGV